MIKVVSKAFNEIAHDSTNIPDLSYPIILLKTKPSPVTRHYHPGVGEYSIEIDFYDPREDGGFPKTPHCQFELGKFLNYETYLEIDGKEYRYSDIYSHEAEMTTIISDAIANQLIEEITDN